MDSIHVKASTLERWIVVVKWIWPVVSTALITTLGFGSRWIISRTSMAEVAPEIAKAGEAAAEAQSAALHCSSLADLRSAQIEQLTVIVLDTWAQSEVDRAYSKSPRRTEYIESARKFYRHEYSEQLDRRKNDPAKALELTRSAEWRPEK